MNLQKDGLNNLKSKQLVIFMQVIAIAPWLQFQNTDSSLK
jgi:hypothetical protein